MNEFFGSELLAAELSGRCVCEGVGYLRKRVVINGSLDRLRQSVIFFLFSNGFAIMVVCWSEFANECLRC